MHGSSRCNIVCWARMGLHVQPKGRQRVAKDARPDGQVTERTNVPRTEGGMFIRRFPKIY